MLGDIPPFHYCSSSLSINKAEFKKEIPGISSSTDCHPLLQFFHTDFQLNDAKWDDISFCHDRCLINGLWKSIKDTPEHVFN